MTTKTGRNQPCPCGSGKKFKQCCLRKEEEAEHKAMAALNQAKQEGRGGSYSDLVKTVDQLAADYEEDVALAEASNAAVKLVRAGKLDEAEQAARDLLVHFPEVHDGYDRLGMVYEARGDNKQAAHYYRARPSSSFASARTGTTMLDWKPPFRGSSPSSTRQPHELIDHVP
jgi:Flp pilus assembly protein TadD